MLRKELISNSPEETIELGAWLAARIQPPTLVMLYGSLGAGKTTLAKGIISGLGAARSEEVTSPTFTLVHAFQNRCRVYHVDLYRVEGAQDLETIGLEDLLSEPAIVVVEWAEKLSVRTAWPIVAVHIQPGVADTRRIQLEAARDERAEATKED